MPSVELKPNQSLYQLLAVYDSPDGVEEIRELASLSVGGVDADGASFMKKKVKEWATADLEQELQKAFTPDPFALLAKAWSQLREVQAAVKASRGPPACSKPVSLAKHEIEAKVEPRMVLTVAGIDWCDVKLALELKLNFDSVILEWTDGHLTELRAGNPTGKISLKCAGQEVASFKRELKLSAKYRFKTPVVVEVPAPALPAQLIATPILQPRAI